MPTTSGFSCNPWDIDARLWKRCRDTIAQEMVSQGWHPKAKKFSEVQQRKARKLFQSKRSN